MVLRVRSSVLTVLTDCTDWLWTVQHWTAAQCRLTLATFRALAKLVALEREEFSRLRAGGSFPLHQQVRPAPS